MVPANLRDIRAFPDLVRYLEDELDWPLREYGFDELTFEFTPAELGLKEEDAAPIKAIHQLRPLAAGQPWGIFFVEFENKKLPVVVLRRILSHLVIKKRASANKAKAPTWHAEDLLFVTAFGDDGTDAREIAFAHFHQNPGDLPTLHVLGWDGGDTPLKLANVDHILRERLHWPEDESDADAWRDAWRKPFKHRIGHVIQTADLLADELARLARGIRDKARRMLKAESDKGPLTKLYKAFQTALIHDLTSESFADTYAQTITYGLLTAAISRTEMSEGRNGTALVAENVVDMVPVTNPFLKEMLQTFLKVGGRKGGIDFDELGIQDVVELLRGDETDLPAILRDFGNRNRGEDPVIHFYEHFLAAYDKQLKVRRGVFYTPQPVVSYIVRSVHELLQTEFGLTDGLADTTTWGEMLKTHPGLKLPPLTDAPDEKRTISPDETFVQILDPATGTATFLVEVIDVIHRTLAAKWQKLRLTDEQQRTAWNDYVPRHLLPRLHAYELMMAPYAIAHMKIGLKLAETGYKFGTEVRARIYLTNALEPWQRQLKLPDFEALAHEATAVNEIKRDKRFTVVIGNPPYSNFGQLNKNPFILGLLDDYKFGLNEKKLNLDDDFIKFVRFSQHVLGRSGAGTLGFITNNVFLEGITHRKMRQALSEYFDYLAITDLHGSIQKREKTPDGQQDENVFDIKQGVAISILAKTTADNFRPLNLVDIYGTRKSKYERLSNAQKNFDTALQVEIASPQYLFRTASNLYRAEYDQGFGIQTMMPFYNSGIQTKKDSLSIHYTEAELSSVLRDMKDRDPEWLRDRYALGDDGRDWSVAWAKEDVLRADGRSFRLQYRPFDFRWSYFTGQSKGFLAYPRKELTECLLSGNLALSTMRQIAGVPDECEVFVTSVPMTDRSMYSTLGTPYLFPLYVTEGNADLFGRPQDGLTRRPNLAPGFLSALSSSLHTPQCANGLPAGLTPEDIFHYIYAVFHSPGYRSRYAEFLKIDFPRLPLTSSLELFRELANIGGELVALHLLESPKVNDFITRFEGKGDNCIPKKPTWKEGAVWINTSQRFEGVPEAVWNFHIGGYQVCEKWLKDRKGRMLSADDIAHYQRIVVVLNETIRLMAEIDRVIEAHGGWPGAFHSSDAKGKA